MKHYNSISFVALSMGWIALLLTHVIWSVVEFGEASGGDTGVIIFWSGLFSLLFYLVFVIVPRKFIQKQLEKRSLIGFAIGSAIYSLLGFVILIGWLFVEADFVGVFVDAFMAGLIAGITFWSIWNKEGLTFNSIVSKILGYAIPVIFLVIYLGLFPILTPKIAYNFVPQSIQKEIEFKTLSKVKIGDSIEVVKSKLPGFIENNKCSGSRSAQYAEFEYRLQWNCCKVVDVEVGERGTINLTLGGPIISEPCQ